MKKLLSIVLCLILVVGCFPLTTLADGDTTIEGDGEASITLTTGVPELDSITVTPPTKTEYNVGEELDTTGMVVMANYNYTDDTPIDVTSDVDLSGFDSSDAGEVTVTVSFTDGDVTKTATFTVTIIVPTYSVTVNNGTGGGSYAQGASVKITANAAPEGQQFNKWTGADGLTFIDGSATTATATFTMPAEAVTLTATYSESGIIPGEYALTLDPNYGNQPVEFITGISAYTLSSLSRDYYNFLGWAESSDGAVRYHAGDTVTLEGNLTLFAKWEGNNIPPSYSLSPTEYTLSGSGYTDIPCTLTSIEAGWISEIQGGILVEAITEVIGFYMNGGTLTDSSGHSIPFLVDNPWHTTGPQQRALQQKEFNMDQQGVTVGMAIYIDPDVFSQAAPGTYTGTFTYDSYWRSYSANTGEVAGESGSIALTLVVPEPESYTVTVEPGDGTGEAFTVDSTTVISHADMLAGNYDETKGCFYLDTDGKVYYMLPSQCPFTAPEGKEFDCWQLDSGSTYSGGASLKADNFTITALYKDQEPEPSITLSIPATINVKYGDTQTAFDVQVKSAVFSQGYSRSNVSFYNSSFSSTAHDGTIPFTVTLTGDALEEVGNADNSYYFSVTDETVFPCSCQGYINITSAAWTAAQPGSYTATLRVEVGFSQ
ncbi:repeat domain (List_Bact_rpt) [Sarcina sp. DSM 11001]|uniref:InlB B-repeat-containing protein n=1 Tax=Sarcina sp. DSM 11001 TaxID=1798184 RepID=UPI00088ABB7A|nr:bacterial Ig-like domain-containing protein [Sarcina sp. DSM 11001]SDM02339.1 repeat domain (List_Bact_rpt) [Sarcina sp. DSM 11001]